MMTTTKKLLFFFFVRALMVEIHNIGVLTVLGCNFSFFFCCSSFFRSPFCKKKNRLFLGSFSLSPQLFFFFFFFFFWGENTVLFKSDRMSERTSPHNRIGSIAGELLEKVKHCLSRKVASNRDTWARGSQRTLDSLNVLDMTLNAIKMGVSTAKLLLDRIAVGFSSAFQFLRDVTATGDTCKGH